MIKHEEGSRSVSEGVIHLYERFVDFLSAPYANKIDGWTKFQPDDIPIPVMHVKQ